MNNLRHNLVTEGNLYGPDVTRWGKDGCAVTIQNKSPVPPASQWTRFLCLAQWCARCWFFIRNYRFTGGKERGMLGLQMLISVSKLLFTWLSLESRSRVVQGGRNPNWWENITAPWMPQWFHRCQQECADRASLLYQPGIWHQVPQWACSQGHFFKQLLQQLIENCLRNFRLSFFALFP